MIADDTGLCSAIQHPVELQTLLLNYLFLRTSRTNNGVIKVFSIVLLLT